MKVTLTRSYHFCAAHRMWNDSFTEEKNRTLYGKCANDDGHGHNYHVEITVGGPQDSGTGMILPREEIDNAMAPILDRLDHHSINEPLRSEGFPVATSEALSAAIWQWLVPTLGDRLVSVRVIETDRNSFVYLGGETNSQVWI